MKKAILVFIFLLNFVFVKAESFSTKEHTLSKVFTDLVSAYGNSKGKPDLKLIPTTSKQVCIATYFANPSPVIKVDEKLFDLCCQMGADSLNALSIILSHELAHYYNDHEWCSDFAFSLRNSTVGKKIPLKEGKTLHEREADNIGLYHSCIAGYKPFRIYAQLINKIYKVYGLNETMPGYPSRTERIIICKQAVAKISKLFEQFQNGVEAMRSSDFDTAIKCFESLVKYFPSRENYFNLGTAKSMKALLLRPSCVEEIRFPEKYSYPLQIEANSRLLARGNSDLKEDSAKTWKSLLNSAKQDLETSISLDRNYEKSYLNLACIYDMLDNPEAAIGKIKEYPNPIENSKVAFRILAIAYHHEHNEKQAEEMFAMAGRQN